MSDKNKSIIKQLNDNVEKIYFIHYSCQSLSDGNEGYSPRITSIAVLHMISEQMSSFSMHLVAEELKILRENIVDHYDEIEKIMLKRFFEFAETRDENSLWLNWNMTNINFGFETLEHRFRVLTGEAPFHIDEKLKYNISALISNRYGWKYVKDPKMQNLMDLNGGRHRNFLTGVEEVTAFKANEFVKMHNSTMCKVYFLKVVIEKLITNTLRTENNQLRYKINELYQNPIVQVLGIIGVIGTIISLMISVIKQ